MPTILGSKITHYLPSIHHRSSLFQTYSWVYTITYSLTWCY